MSDASNTLFLRLEGPMQAWGDNSKFVIRRTMEAPTKSGVIGLVCCAMGLSRQTASERLPELNGLAMGVRIDRPGTRWWDYHTVGAGIGLLTAKGDLKTGAQGTLITRREYLCDASFFVGLQGGSELIQRVKDALENPKWPLFLGRKCCPPAVPVVARPEAHESWTNPMLAENGLLQTLRSVPWRPRYKERERPKSIELDCVVEWRSSRNEPIAPADAEVWYDAPVSFEPPVHEPRLVQRTRIEAPVGGPLQKRTPPPPRVRADYRNAEYKRRRVRRLESDHGLCVFCKSPATTVQHITYRRAGGNEEPSDLCSLCRLCHDAVTMIEYGLGMGLDRIDPKEPRWRDDILRARDEIRQWRSEEGRRRALRDAPQRTRREVLEEDEV
jgi:CRISPR-associated protein Cas5/CasD subtype I-E